MNIILESCQTNKIHTFRREIQLLIQDHGILEVEKPEMLRYYSRIY